jgi:hypothetical protein
MIGSIDMNDSRICLIFLGQFSVAYLYKEELQEDVKCIQISGKGRGANIR